MSQKLQSSNLPRRAALAAMGAAITTPFVAPKAKAVTDDLACAIASLHQLHSLQVKRGDDLVFAEAPRGRGLTRLANIKSCSKSLVALLLGAAIAKGEVGDVRATLASVAPDLIPPNATDGVADITMEDLVTLRAGLERTSGANYGGWIGSGNWVADALTRPMVAPPGGPMLYSTGTTHVLGAALSEAADMSLHRLMVERLGEPLGIEIPRWTRDPQGYFLGGNEMALTPQAMLRIAELILGNGAFEGARVIPAAWIEASLRPHTRSRFSGLAYGYGWFLSRSGYAIARGYGGQIIAAHPARGLAVAITSDPTRPARSGGYFGDLMALLDGPILDLSQT